MRRLLPVLGAGLLWVAPASLAQDGQRPAPSQGGKRAASPSAPKNAWVKLCETPKAPAKDILGRPQAVGVESCLTVAERVNAGTGARLIGVGVRQSGKRRTLTVMVPAGVDRRGMLVVIYPHSQWKLGAKGVLPEKHKWDQLTSLKLAYTSCDAVECMAETDATPELIKDLRTKAGLVVSTIRDKRIVLLPIALGGFRAAYDGPGVDSARFRKARDELMRELRERSKKRPGQPAKRPGDQEI